jgi:VWFA-related protein
MLFARYLSLCLTLIISPAGFPDTLGDGAPTFRVTSELVLVDVQVLRAKTGTPAPLLNSSDLILSEEGVPQQIAHFSRDEFPLSVVLLFDLTDSVHNVLKHLADGARMALGHFKPEDEIAVMAYSGGATLVDDFTRNREQTLAAIGKAAEMTSDEPAHFNEGIYQAASELHKSSPSNRRVVIWLTDNLPNVPYRKMDWPIHTEVEAFRALHEDNVVVAPILMKSILWATLLAPLVDATEAPKRKAYPPGDAHKYAELTGGQAVGMRGKRPEERLAQLIDELRARYTIGYRPSDPQPAGAFRKISIRLAPSGNLRAKEWKVLAREGYYRK